MATTVVSILVPVYNNAAYLRELCARIDSTLAKAELEYELLLVNDGSRDGSWDEICTLAEGNKRIKGLCFSRNFGQHAAISGALEHASGSEFILMDADLQDRPELIPDLLGVLRRENRDIVYTIKESNSEGWFRYITSHAFHSFVGTTTGSQTASNLGTFRAFNLKVANALRCYRERAVVYGPLMHTMGFDSTFVVVPRDPRIGSGSSYSFSRRLALAFQSIMSYSALPQKMLLWSGGVISAMSIIYLLVIVTQHVMGGAGLPPGLTLLATLLLFLIGILMMGLGIIASYLFLVYREVLDRPRYHVQNSINLDVR